MPKYIFSADKNAFFLSCLKIAYQNRPRNIAFNYIVRAA